MHMVTLKSAGAALALAGALALTAGQATQVRPQGAEEAAALYGAWKGSWSGGGGEFAITIRPSEDATPGVTYCFKNRCWDPADVALKDGALTVTADDGSLSNRFVRKGERLRATLKKGARTFRSRMKREATPERAAYGLEGKDWGRRPDDGAARFGAFDGDCFRSPDGIC